MLALCWHLKWFFPSQTMQGKALFYEVHSTQDLHSFTCNSIYKGWPVSPDFPLLRSPNFCLSLGFLFLVFFCHLIDLFIQREAASFIQQISVVLFIVRSSVERSFSWVLSPWMPKRTDSTRDSMSNVIFQSDMYSCRQLGFWPICTRQRCIFAMESTDSWSQQLSWKS